VQIGSLQRRIEAAQREEIEMSVKNIITLISTAAISTVLAAACGNSRDEDPTTPIEKAASAQPKAETKAVKNGFDAMPAPGTDARCPVMKKDFKVTADSTYSVYKGKTYVFCCPGCKPPFDENPEKFTKN
jgi:YHS domain-containing protein